MKGCVRVFSEYMEDYYRSKIGVKEICKLAGSSPTTFRRWMKKENLTPRQTYFKNINTGIISLDQVLKDRYSSIVNRCNGKTTDYYGKYKGLPYMTIYEWVEFCHDNKEKLLKMWGVFIENRDCGSKYSISVDRIDEADGYTKENIQFVTHGFNSWKRSVFPIKVTYLGKINYFLTREDASNFYGLRKQAIGEVYNKRKYALEGYEVEDTSIDTVLKKNGMRDLSDYYQAKHLN